MPLPYDDKIEIGYGWFSLGDDHPFYRAAKRHDQAYDDIIAGTSPKTLKQIDKEFYWNCMRIAASEAWFLKDIARGVDLTRQASVFYKLCRIWANLFRSELEAYRPK